MIFLKKFQYKTFAIYGMGKSGRVTAKVLLSSKLKVLCWDDDLKIRNKLKKHNFPIEQFWKKNKIDYIVISPGIDIKKCKAKNFLKKNSDKIITDIDLFFENYRKNVIISITGTNGKSTTCKIIEKVLNDAGYETETGGNIGKPILALKKLKKNGVYILEISSYQLEYSKEFRSKHAAILNVFPDHLERHNNLKNYIRIKSKIFFAQEKSDFSYINAMNKYSKDIKKIVKSRKIKSKFVYITKNNSKFLFKKIHNKYLKNENNLENLFFAYQIAKKLNIKSKIFFKSINSFRGLPHRQEVIFMNKCLTCVNDSKATSFASSFYSLRSFNRIYWILGGLPKFKDNFYLRDVSHKIIKAYVIGKQPKYFQARIPKTIPCLISHNVKRAVKQVVYDIKKNKDKNCTILFSPAAASFDQFNNFEDRGNYFKFLVKKYLRNVQYV